MPERPAADGYQPTLPLLLGHALVFLWRDRMVFALVALPVAGLAAGIDWILEDNALFIGWRNHWGWDFLFALVYAMFLDRWIKESLLENAYECEEVEEFRRSLIAPRFLFYAAVMFVVAYALSVFPTDWFFGPESVAWLAPGRFFAILLPWLPHLVFWSLILALFCLVLPSVSAAEPLTLGEALRLGRAQRAVLIKLILVVAFLSLVGYALSHWGLQHLPRKAWAAAATTAAHRLFDCLLIAITGNCLATIYSQITDWRQPESADHPYRGLGKPPRRFPSV